MTTVSLIINDEDMKLIKKFVKVHNLTFSDFAREAMFEKIEDEYDLKELRQAMLEDEGEHLSHAEVMKEFGL
ncbi:type II toxin-antitoxin system RelB family antitoxin [Xylocopilactobacillus apis]|uniref:CopG family transcriptional regulator n=1 Tax=Xylocopilactobacillus apis TaxID=2932183 RepID=A0AAU9CZQ7_9LACO|nr:DUF6290 family protein [Xylocopilactobacillus apis]BDR55490.1 hypothetical protein KIMC2_00520 [Xylocopilactobacillus apis]